MAVVTGRKTPMKTLLKILGLVLLVGAPVTAQTSQAQMDDARLAAIHEVWTWTRGATWLVHGMYTMRCVPRTPKIVRCTITRPNSRQPRIVLDCDTGRYPFNDECVWLEGDD